MSAWIRKSTVVLGMVAMGLAGCGQAPQSTAPVKKPPSEASKQWAQTANGFVEDYLRAQPFFAAQSGRHEFDGQLPDFSAHGIKREISRLHDARQQLAAVDPAPLEPRERFDREYLLSVVDKDLFWLEKAKYPATNPYWYINEIDPDMYLSRNYAPLETRMKAYIRYAQGIPRVATDIQANLQGPLPKTFVELGITDFGGLADFFTKNVAPVFASVADPALQKQLDDADKNAAVAMNNVKTYLIGLRKTATDKFPLGNDLFAEMLKDTERVEVPVDQIEAAGKADLERNMEALKTECATYLPKGTPAACMAKMAADKTSGSVLDSARTQLAELKKFVQDNNVVSIPSNEDALVAEAPPYNRSNFRLHPDSGSLRSRGGLHLQHRAARPFLAQGGAGGLRPGQRRASVHVGSRSLAWALPPVPAFERQSGETRSAVGGIRVRGGLGALLRRDDV